MDIDEANGISSASFRAKKAKVVIDVISIDDSDSDGAGGEYSRLEEKELTNLCPSSPSLSVISVSSSGVTAPTRSSPEVIDLD